MKKNVKLLLLTVLIITFVAALSACGNKSKVTQKNADWVKMGYHYNDVERYLGSPNDSLIQQNAYYWFDGAKNIQDANKKLTQGKTVRLIAIIFDGDNRVSRVQFTTLTENNKAILTEDIIGININVTDENYEKVKKSESYYDIISIFGIASEEYIYADSRCCYWFDGASSIQDAYAKAAQGKTVRFLEISFNNSNKVATFHFELIQSAA